MTEPLFFDTDCISAFLWVNNESILSKLFPGRIVIPKEVYDELSHPGVNRVKGLKAQVDLMLQAGNATIESIMVGTDVDPRESLLDMLRNHLGLTSVKKGCEVGECGACTVIIDGETIDSCIYLAVWAEGKNIRTLEGLEKDGQITRIQEAFIEEGAVQCGFCTPGFIMSATVLLEQGKELTRDEIRKKMSGNLCRCTGYQNIVNAVDKVMHENAESSRKE